MCQTMEVELADQLADEGVFRGFHLAARPAF